MEAEKEAQFPKDWPPGCPPPEAVPAKGVVYRTCGSSPPSSDDFKSYLEQGKAPNACRCQRAGISVFRDFHDATHHASHFPRSGGLVSKCELKPEHGKMKPTPSSKTGPSHTTWWPVEGLERASIFSLVKTSIQ